MAGHQALGERMRARTVVVESLRLREANTGISYYRFYRDLASQALFTLFEELTNARRTAGGAAAKVSAARTPREEEQFCIGWSLEGTST